MRFSKVNIQLFLIWLIDGRRKKTVHFFSNLYSFHATPHTALSSEDEKQHMFAARYLRCILLTHLGKY
jgi:hypothetical protein